VHELADRDEAFAKLTAGVEVGEILGLEVEASADVDGERVAESQHHGGRRGGRELVVAGLAVYADVEYIQAGLGERRFHATGEGYQRYAEMRKNGQQTKEFLALAGVGEREQDIAAVE
jgi:precorrin isomerase